MTLEELQLERNKALEKFNEVDRLLNLRIKNELEALNKDLINKGTYKVSFKTNKNAEIYQKTSFGHKLEIVKDLNHSDALDLRDSLNDALEHWPK